jgi:PII-like signaling protein
MEPQSNAELLRIFIGESDKIRHLPLFEVIVREAKAAGLAGATAWRGMMGFGPTSRIRTAKILDLSADMPVIVEITDSEDKISGFLPVLDRLFEESQCGGLVTMERVQIIRYAHGNR